MTHQARKRFGQNFLENRYYQHEIIQSLHIQPTDHWVEVGPGQGAITDHLVKQRIRLDLVELDRDLVALLQQRYRTEPQLTIHSQDALTVDFCAFNPTQPIRLVGNLPYNISTPLIFHFLTQRQCLQDAHFLLQKEVVERLCASPGEKAYGKLSVMIQQAFQTTPLFDIPPEAFRPAPKVLSSFVRLVPHTKPIVQINNQRVFAELVKQAFAQKRKTLRNNLKGLLTPERIQTLGIDPGCRAETLTLQDFATLANAGTTDAPL